MASPNTFVLAKQLKTTNLQLQMKARLVRTYENLDIKNPTIVRSRECLFHDSEMTYVHATIPRDLVEKFRGVFKEGASYNLSHFLVVTNTWRYKLSENKYSIRFNRKTNVVELEEEFPKQMFRLIPIQTLLEPANVDDKKLIDVIGRIAKIYPPADVEVDGSPAKVIEFIIEDHLGNGITCCVWNKHVQTILPYYNSQLQGPVIVLLQLCRAKVSERTDKVKLSSSYDATQLWLNHDCQEFTVFKQSLEDHTSAAMSITSLPKSFGMPTVEDFTSGNMTLSKIGDIYERNTLGDSWVCAKVSFLETDRGWFYNACVNSKCKKKLVDQDGLMFCEKCQRSYRRGIIKFKVVAKVDDMTADASLLLWDRECTEILGVTAGEVYEKYKDTGDYPAEIEAMEDQSFLFSINVKMENLEHRDRPVSVNKIIKDSEVVSPLSIDFYGSQETDLISKYSHGQTDDGEGDASGDEAESPDTVVLKKRTAIDDGEQISCKRRLLDQLSSTDSLKKSRPIIVKKEE